MKIQFLKDQTKYKTGDIVSLPKPIALLLVWSGNAKAVD